MSTTRFSGRQSQLTFPGWPCRSRASWTAVDGWVHRQCSPVAGNVRRMPTPLTADTIATAPKVLLHDHLDGGLRPATLVDLADRDGYDGLPATVVPDLARWFS